MTEMVSGYAALREAAMRKALEQHRRRVRAMSLGDVRLRGLGVEQSARNLEARGFRGTAEGLLCARGRSGEAHWLRLDGGSTADPNEPGRLVFLAYTHLDGGMVRIFPFGNPRIRHAPPGKPFAQKSVVLDPPREWVDPNGRVVFKANPSFENIAFHVTDDGVPVPRSFREADGVRSFSDEPRENWKDAVALARSGIIELAGDLATPV